MSGLLRYYFQVFQNYPLELLLIVEQPVEGKETIEY